MTENGPLCVGIGGPVGSGKTTITAELCKAMRDKYSIAVVTNDIYMQEDATINLQAISDLNERHPDLDVVFIESGGDNLAATFSPELADITLYIISVCQGEEIPRKGGPAITRSDLLIINKQDLAPYVGTDLDVMTRDATSQRQGQTFYFTNAKSGGGCSEIVDFLAQQGGL